MTPNSKFTSYPATIRYWFATYAEARARLDRATNKTDIDSAVQDKASRAQRRKKQFETDAESDEESSTPNNVLKSSIQKRKKRKNDSKKLKIKTVVLPNFSSLPVLPKSASSVCVPLSVPVSNKKLKVGKNEKIEGVNKTNVKVLSKNTSEKNSRGQESLLGKSISKNTLKEELYRENDSLSNKDVADKLVSHNDDIQLSEKSSGDVDYIPESAESSDNLFDDDLVQSNEACHHFSYSSSEGEQSQSPSTSLVNRNENDEPPQVNRNENDEPPQVNRNEKDDPPQVNRNENDEPPQVNRNENDDPPQNKNAEANNEKGTSVIALFKQVLEKVNMIDQRQIKMENNVEEVKQLLLNGKEALKHPRNFPKLPLQSFNDSTYLEDKINRNDALKEYVIKRLCLAARGASDKECAKRVMEKLMSNHVGTFYSWQGSGGKKESFKNTAMVEAVRLAIKKLRSDVDVGAAEDSIKEWLKSRKFAKNNAAPNIE